jgi:hypothetical protein
VKDCLQAYNPHNDQWIKRDALQEDWGKKIKDEDWK